jgi:hypothetical protein
MMADLEAYHSGFNGCQMHQKKTGDSNKDRQKEHPSRPTKLFAADFNVVDVVERQFHFFVRKDHPQKRRSVGLPFAVDPAHGSPV